MRLFVAIEIPSATKAALATVVASLQSLVPSARWTAEAGWHATLKFLGEVAEDRLPVVVAAVDGCGGGGASVSVRLAGLGAFPSPKRAKVVWAGLDEEQSGVLGGIAARLDAAVAVPPLAIPPEERAWTPHLTLARLKVPATVAAALSAAGPMVAEPVVAEPFAVSSMVLFRSHLSGSGARYEALERFPL